MAVSFRDRYTGSGSTTMNAPVRVRTTVPKPEPDDAAPSRGLRERNKADKLRRIKAAARELFTKKGYEATTTREIAELAGVSVGTVFVYAKDKGDLVCLMAIDR